MTESWHSLSPLDGRYAQQTSSLTVYFSEAAFIRYRVHVELVYLEHLLLELHRQLPLTFDQVVQGIRADRNLVSRVKMLEQETQHDVKAIEYAIGEKLTEAGLGEYVPWVHWGLTSEDVNNLAYGGMIKAALEDVMFPAGQHLLEAWLELVENHAGLPMLARTHGQPASPTTVGKEMALFAHRFMSEMQELARHKAVSGKQNGASGNWNVHQGFFPDHDWPTFSKNLVESLGLNWAPVTTQIVTRESYARVFDTLRRMNNIAIDCSRDCWTYVSLGYFQLRRRKASEVGSSAMPHKINPVNFENAEGNLEMANAILTFLSDKLLKSRMQRDLSDSTVLRNIGVVLGYTLVGYQSLLAGLKQLSPNEARIQQDVLAHWEVLAEPMQHALRLANREIPYEKLRQATQGQQLTQAGFTALCQELDIALPLSQPLEYTGLAEKTAHNMAALIRDYLLL